MAGTDLLGEFEQLVLLALLKHEENGYAILVRRTLEEVTERSVSRGALYRTLDRMAVKGLVGFTLEEPTEDRGGLPRKRFHILHPGLEALRRSRSVVAKLSAGLEDVLEQAT